MSESNLSRLSEAYLAALRTHLAHGEPADLALAHELGTQAVSLKLETLDLARVHDLALAGFLQPDCPQVERDEVTGRAAAFFTEALVPLEKTHPMAQETDADILRLKATLNQCTLELADTNRDLKRGILNRKLAEADLESSERTSSRLLEDSHLVEKNLQNITHQIMLANEAERKIMSLQLHDEIAQTLLGIHVRLLTLKQQVAARDVSLSLEIATTQRLVEESVKTIHRFAHEYGTHP
jgi:signal transduction histidine kinase